MTELNDRIDLFQQTHGETCREALPLLREMAQALSEAQAENERLREGFGRVAQKLEASDLIDLAHSAINDRYGAAKTCIQKALRELEALHDA